MTTKAKSSRTSSDKRSPAMRAAKATMKKGVKISMATACEVGKKIGEHIPEATARGFGDGRKVGNDAFEAIPYAAGVAAGVSFGVSEAIVNAVATPANVIFGLGVGLGSWAHRQFCEDEDAVEVVELA
jgi:hypothetical protein